MRTLRDRLENTICGHVDVGVSRYSCVYGQLHRAACTLPSRRRAAPGRGRAVRVRASAPSMIILTVAESSNSFARWQMVLVPTTTRTGIMTGMRNICGVVTPGGNSASHQWGARRPNLVACSRLAARQSERPHEPLSFLVGLNQHEKGAH